MASIFISHRNADSRAAELLAIELRDRGHIVWLDIWNIGIGDSIIEQINTGLTDSFMLSYVILMRDR